jgi:hypothetical protein
MLGSPLLGTAVGLALLFATTALLCSGVTESLSNILQLRAKYLLTGMRAMLDTPAGDKGRAPGTDPLHDRVKNEDKTKDAADLVRGLTPSSSLTTEQLATSPVTTALWNSPLLRSLQSRRVTLKSKVRNPQYVSGRTFARALVDLLVPADPDGGPPVFVTIGRIRHAVEQLPDTLPVRQPLLTFLARAGNDVNAFESAVEHWYDEQMAKIGGWYKRWARVVLGVVGFVVAVLVNVDTVQAAHALYVDAPLQQAVVATANAGTLCQDVADVAARNKCATNELADLKADGLPLGYPSTCDPAGGAWQPCWQWSATAAPHRWDLWLKLAGWLVTAFAVSFGAPFWFDALSKLGSLRNAGTKPATSS